MHSVAQVDDELDVIFNSSIEKVYLPAYRSFYDTALSFSNASTTAGADACRYQNDASLNMLKQQYKDLVAKFSFMELYRIGPLLENNRQNRLFYWPDKRRVGERQLRTLLSADDAANLTAQDLEKKSVALQGLPALERLLFGGRAQAQLGQSSWEPDCRVVQAIAGNILSMAGQIRESWQPGHSFIQSLLNPAADSEYFRNKAEVLRSLVTQIVIGIEVVLERKLKPMLEADARAYRQAPLWRSGQTINMISQNLNGLRALVLDTGLAARAELANELTFEFRTAGQLLQQLAELESLVDEAGMLTTRARSLLTSLVAVVGGVQYTLNDRFTAALGVKAGFNSEDGD